jgi:sugar phosphate isomerase/epimerase
MNEPRNLTRRDFLFRSGAAAVAVTAGLPVVRAAEPAARAVWSIIGFTKPFQDLDFNTTAETVAEIGWDGVECPVRPRGQIEPEKAADELPALVEALRRVGKQVTILATGITRADDPHAESLLRTASSLGIRRYRLGSWRYRRDESIAKQLTEIGAALKELAALNKELGLQAGFQNHSGRDTVGAPVWDIWTLIRAMNPAHMGLCFDIGHATVEGGLSWPTEARLVEDRLTAVFVKDFTWRKTDRGWQPEWVMLGEGMVDRGFFRWLKGTAYQGPICQHHEYDHGRGKPMIARMQKDLEVLRGWLAE